MQQTTLTSFSVYVLYLPETEQYSGDLKLTKDIRYATLYREKPKESDGFVALQLTVNFQESNQGN